MKYQYIHARVSDEKKVSYIEHAKHFAKNLSAWIVLACDEYIKNHPVKK
jgi:hypothetical protein